MPPDGKLNSVNRMNREERYSWISLATGAIIFFIYLRSVSGLVAAGRFGIPETSGTFLWIIGLVIGIEIITAILLAVSGRILDEGKVEKDERDRQINLKAYRVSHYAILGGVNLAILYGLVYEGFWTGEAGRIPATFLLFHALFAVLFISHLTFYGSRVILYRLSL